MDPQRDGLFVHGRSKAKENHMSTARIAVAVVASLLFGGFVTVVFLQHSAAAQESAKVPVPNCTFKVLSSPAWEMAVCTVGTKTCVAVAGHSTSGVMTPIGSTNVTCF